MAIDSARRNTIKVVMLGGAGFLGYFTCTELMRRGHRAIAVGLAEPKPGLLPAGCSFAAINADTCTDAELMALLGGTDAVIHATGADGRNSFPAPAIDGFRAANVAPVERLVQVMQQARVPRLVIMASYYTALARLFPDMGFLGHNPYPVSRHEQAKAAFDAGPDLDIAVLELPFIFGGAPGRGTLWGFIIDKIQKAEGPVPVGAGGSACVSAAQVAAAAVGAIERSNGHRHYPIGGENLSHASIYGHFARAIGVERRFTVRDPDLASAAAMAQRGRLSEGGIETGYDPVAVSRWEEAPLFLDPAPAMEALGYGPDDIGTAIADTVAATLAHGGRGPASLQSDKEAQ